MRSAFAHSVFSIGAERLQCTLQVEGIWNWIVFPAHLLESFRRLKRFDIWQNIRYEVAFTGRFSLGGGGYSFI